MLHGLYVPLDLSSAAERLDTCRGPARKVAKQLRRRAFSVRGQSLTPTAEVLYLVAMRLTRRPHRLFAWRGTIHDRAMARFLNGVRTRPWAVIGMPFASRHTFAWARAHGVTTFFNHVNCNLHTENDAFETEARTSPRDESPAILSERWPAELVRHADQEVGLAHYVLVPSSFVRDDLVARGSDPRKLIVLPYGVDTRLFHPAHREASTRPLRLLYVGQVGYRKGLRYVFEAVRLANPRPERLTLVGPVVNDSPILDQAPPATSQVGLISHSELNAYYATSDVFVLPSLADAFGLVVLEAMAAGLPVIVTRETGAAEIVRDGVEGFVVPSRDARAIADRLNILSQDGQLRQRMGQAARQRAETYSWTRFETQFLEAIARVQAADRG